MRAVHVKPAQVLQAIGFAMFGAALFKALGPLVSPADHYGTGSDPEGRFARDAPPVGVDCNEGFDPFTEGPQPLRIIKVASKDHYDRPLFNMPHVWMSVHHNEYISDSMHKDLYGPSWWFKMLGAVQVDKLFVDVGFNIGGVGIVAAAQGMRVIGFEPVRANWILGQQSIKLNHLQGRVKLHHAAVHWEKQTMRILHNFSKEADGKFNAGQGTLGVRKDQEGVASADKYEEVDTISLSDAVQEDVWLMKFDVEGCECHCLKSAKTLFERHTVNYVFIETDRAASANCGCSPQFFVDFFQKAGFGACKTFEGHGADRTCAEFDELTAANWFHYHDRFLRRKDAPLLPGKPMVEDKSIQDW